MRYGNIYTIATTYASVKMAGYPCYNVHNQMLWSFCFSRNRSKLENTYEYILVTHFLCHRCNGKNSPRLCCSNSCVYAMLRCKSICTILICYRYTFAYTVSTYFFAKWTNTAVPRPLMKIVVLLA